MSIDRIKRVNELLKRVLTQGMYDLIGSDELDHAAVTIRTVEVTRDLHQAKVGVSILGHETDRNKLLSVMKRHRREMQSYINREMTLRFTPRLNFVLDDSVERGDRVLDLLHKMEVDDQPVADQEDSQ